MAAHEPEAHGGPVPKPKKFSVPRRKQDGGTDSTRSRRRWQPASDEFKVAFVAVFVVFFVALVCVLLAFPASPGGYPRYKLEFKQLGDLQHAIRDAAGDERKRRELNAGEVRDLKGVAFYEAAFKRQIFERDVVSKLVSLNSTTDTKADRAWISETDGQMPDNACSYTAPRAGDLPELLERKGEDRVVLVTFNARNWNNYPEHGVIVLWSDADAGEFLTFKEARKEWGITEEEWADPAGKLFGKKAPFQFTYE